jgi:hypothetical protein
VERTIATWTFEVVRDGDDVWVNWAIEPGESVDVNITYCGTTDGTLAYAIQAAYDAAGLVFPFVEDSDLVRMSGAKEEAE